MTDFSASLRHMCRNPKCRSKLPAPVTNAREAFCTRGCHTSYYLHRCIVCEGQMVRKREDQRVCKKSKCRSSFRAGFDGGRYSASSDARSGSKNLDSIESKPPLKADLPWRIIAGPRTPSGFHCAAVPDAKIVNGVPTWEGGSYQRIEASTRRSLEAYFGKMDSDAVNVCGACGRDDDLVDVKVAVDRWQAVCRGCRDKALRHDQAMAVVKPADLDTIPDFLRRPPPQAAPLKLAA
jgi:hypothetical protein